MDGLLVVDKPSGPTSHEVVARVRRALGERRIGHTGTLDPTATGVLPLVLGRATRLARFLSAREKSYEAEVRLGVATDTYDAAGTPVGPSTDGPWPSPADVERALDTFRGTFEQQPPAYSAKKIDGSRSYALARRRSAHAAAATAPPEAPDIGSATLPAVVSVTTSAVELLGCEGDLVTLRVDCSAGFYVRSLAHDLGGRLGTGAHLLALRRIRSGDVTLEQALGLDVIERDPARARAALVPLSGMLPGLAAVTLTADGVRHAVHGRDLGPVDLLELPGSPAPPWLRLLDTGGGLVGIGAPVLATGLLHPAVVLV